MKKYIKPIIGILFGIIFLIATVYGYPSKWFIHGTFGSLDTPTIIYLVNAAIFSILIPLTMFFLGFFKNLGKDIFIKYGIIFILTLLTGLLGQFFGHFNGYGYIPDFGIIFYSAFLCNFLRNFSEVLSLIVLVKSISLLFEFKYKVLVLTISSAIIYGLFMVLYHLGMIPIAISMYLLQGLGIGALTGYLVAKENSLITPAVFFGVYGLTLLPNYFAVNSSITTVTRIVLIVLYALLFIFFILATVYDILQKEKKKKEMKETIKKELMEEELFTKEGIEEYFKG